MKVDASEFLKAHPNCWISRQGAALPVINAHAVDIAAPPERVFAELATCDLVLPRWHWKALFAIRALLGKAFGWDRGLRMHGPEPLVPGNHYCFFQIEHVAPVQAPEAAPRGAASGLHELGLSVENKLTLALVGLVIEPAGAGSRLFNVTCARFKGKLGDAYWRIIRPFHDGITEDSLAAVRRRAEKKS